MPFAAALSEHPVTAYATGEACGQLLEAIGPHPDAVLVFVTLAHAGALEDIAATVRTILGPSVLVGAASDTVVATGRVVERGPAVSLWAGRWGPVAPVRLDPSPSPPPLAGDVGFDPTTLVVLGDPHSFDPSEVVRALGRSRPGLRVVGGMAGGSRGPGGSRLVLDGAVHTDGAVGLLLGPGADAVAARSQACRPVGIPLVVTDGADGVVRTLAGRPALERLEQLAAGLSPAEVHHVNRSGLLLGRLIDERVLDPGAGDFAVCDVLGMDRSSGALAVDGRLEVGTIVQFHLRDGDGARQDLEALLVRHAGPAEPEAALLFTGSGLAGDRPEGGDAHLLHDHLGPIPVAGLGTVGVLGPVGASNTSGAPGAALLLLREHR